MRQLTSELRRSRDNLRNARAAKARAEEQRDKAIDHAKFMHGLLVSVGVLERNGKQVIHR